MTGRAERDQSQLHNLRALAEVDAQENVLEKRTTAHAPNRVRRKSGGARRR